MKKTTLSILAMIVFALGANTNASAQKISFGLTLGGAFPMGAFGAAPTVDFASQNPNLVGTAAGGFSFGLHARYHINDNMAAGINVGYSIFLGQDLNVTSTSNTYTGAFAVLPVMAAFDYYFMTDKIKPYVGLELGYIKTGVIYNTDPTTTASGGGIAFAPVIGCRFDFTDHFGLLASIKYMYGMNEHKFDIATANSNPNGDIGIPATSYLGVNVGVNFTFGSN